MTEVTTGPEVVGFFRPARPVSEALAARVGEEIVGLMLDVGSPDPLYAIRFADGRWTYARLSEIDIG